MNYTNAFIIIQTSCCCQVYPIQGFPDQEICDVSTKLINEHLERFTATSRILQQVQIRTRGRSQTRSLRFVALCRLSVRSPSSASEHRAGAPHARLLHLQRERLQLLRLRAGEQSVYLQISLCVLRPVGSTVSIFNPTTHITIKAQLIFDRIHLQLTGSQTFKISGPKAVAGVVQSNVLMDFHYKSFHISVDKLCYACLLF